MIEFDNVSFDFPGKAGALRNVNLKIDRGEQLAVVGGNGSGKTTFALMVNGILRPRAGAITVAGLNPAVPENGRRLKTKVGMVFQNPDNQLVSSTVEREIAFALENRNIPAPRIRISVRRMLELFELAGFENRLTSELSGGEKQRLALAAVMVAEPDILILDEPGSYLDQSGRLILEEALGKLRTERPDLTLIHITQYSSVASAYGRIVVFDGGRIALDGPPEEIYGNVDVCRKAGIEVPLSYRIQQPRESGSISVGVDRPVSGKRISVENASFRFDKSGGTILEGINLDISGSTITGLVGPTGSGKSTLIQLMAGLLKPAAGEIRCHDFEPAPGEIVISFQQPERQFFLETVEREMRFGPENLGLDDIDIILNSTYPLIGLSRERFAERDPFSLSAGEKRRVAFGTVISMRPNFIFFDEPTCALDSRGITRFKDLVSELRSNGAGIIIISHYGEIIFELADTVIHLERGKVVGRYDKVEFFRKVDYRKFLSMPEVLKYQLDRFGEIRSYSPDEFRGIIGL